MKIKDKILLKHGDNIFDEVFYISETTTQYLLTSEKNIVDISDSDDIEGVILVSGNIGVTKFTPVKKLHNFVRVDENTYELDIEPIEQGNL